MQVTHIIHILPRPSSVTYKHQCYLILLEMWSTSDYFLEDIVQMLDFMPPPPDKKRRHGDDDAPQDGDEKEVSTMTYFAVASLCSTCKSKLY